MTDIFGIQIPSTDPVLLGIVGLHILFGLASVATGLLAMLLRKGRGRHSQAGTVYFYCLVGLFLTLAALSIMRWQENRHLFVVGLLCFASACLGRIAIHSRLRGRVRYHVIAMGASFVALLTGFYVDNGKNLPLWNMLPQIAFWLLPPAIGLPVILWTMSRHPLLRNRPPNKGPSGDAS